MKYKLKIKNLLDGVTVLETINTDGGVCYFAQDINDIKKGTFQIVSKSWVLNHKNDIVNANILEENIYYKPQNYTTIIALEKVVSAFYSFLNGIGIRIKEIDSGVITFVVMDLRKEELFSFEISAKKDVNSFCDILDMLYWVITKIGDWNTNENIFDYLNEIESVEDVEYLRDYMKRIDNKKFELLKSLDKQFYGYMDKLYGLKLTMRDFTDFENYLFTKGIYLKDFLMNLNSINSNVKLF